MDVKALLAATDAAGVPQGRRDITLIQAQLLRVATGTVLTAKELVAVVNADEMTKTQRDIQLIKAWYASE
jgi:hypothetical protein